MATAEKIHWYRTPLPREVRDELTRRSDLRGFLHAGTFLLIYVTTTALCLLLFLRQQWVAMVAMCYIHSVFHGFMGKGASVHELSHNTAFKTKQFNDFFFRLFAFLTWSSYLHFKESHTKHHHYTVYDDLDKEVPPNQTDFRWYHILSWFTFDYKLFKQMIWTNVQHALGNTDVDFFWWCPLLSKENIKTKKLIGWARTMILGHVLIFAIFAYFRLWVLIYCVNFGTFFATFLLNGCRLQQHAGLTRNVPDWRVVAYSAKFGPLMSYLYWNMNYHAEHHMYAAVPFYNLPRLHKALENDLPEPINGYWRGVLHVLRVRHRQKSDPDYRFMPRFPETAAPPKLA